jgi:hypothetical protein
MRLASSYTGPCAASPALEQLEQNDADADVDLQALDGAANASLTAWGPSGLRRSVTVACLARWSNRRVSSMMGSENWLVILETMPLMATEISSSSLFTRLMCSASYRCRRRAFRWLRRNAVRTGVELFDEHGLRCRLRCRRICRMESKYRWWSASLWERSAISNSASSVQSSSSRSRETSCLRACWRTLLTIGGIVASGCRSGQRDDLRMSHVTSLPVRGLSYDSFKQLRGNVTGKRGA